MADLKTADPSQVRGPLLLRPLGSHIRHFVGRVGSAYQVHWFPVRVSLTVCYEPYIFVELVRHIHYSPEVNLLQMLWLGQLSMESREGCHTLKDVADLSAVPCWIIFAGG